MLANCGHDEHGACYSGGKAGDQTGTEFEIRTYYVYPNGGWTHVFRHPNTAVREEIAKLAERAAKNDKVGYDQSERWTFWDQLKVSNYDPAKITVNCETDCSASELSICKAVGYRLNITALKNINQNGYTGNQRAILKTAGFQVLTDKKYLTSDKYLLRGDILLAEGHHTCTNLTNGSLSGASSSTASSTTTTILKFGSTGSEVKELQTNLNKLGYNCGTVDGNFGSKTDAAVRAFQHDKGLDVDGQVGKDTKAKIAECLKALANASSNVQNFKSYYVGTGVKGMLVGTDLNLRTKPVNGNEKGVLKKGTYVFPTERTAGGTFPSYWFKVNGLWCSGKYLQGWVLDKTANKWWYNDNGSYPKSKWLKIGGVWYYFKSDGYMAANTYVKASGKNLWYYVDKNGAWQTSKDVTVKPSNVVV